MTDLNNVRFFVEAADTGSFSAAARVLGVLPSMVSRKIARLEADVGARLFQRSTRALLLTDAGQAFLEHARAALHSFTLAEELVGGSGGALKGRIRLSAPAGAVDSLWIALSRFLTLHPGVQVELEGVDRYVDLVEERFDMAIRSRAEGRTEHLVGRRLAAAPRGLVAGPDYLKARGVPRSVTDLEAHDCVILGPRADRASWHLHIGQRVHKLTVRGRVAVNEATLAAQCAADGFGIAFLPLAVCAQRLASGQLVRVLPRVHAGDVGMWLVYPDRHLSPACRALAEFLVKEYPGIVAVRKS